MLRRTARRAFAVDTGEPPPAEFPLTRESGASASVREQAVQRLFDGLVDAIRSQVERLGRNPGNDGDDVSDVPAEPGGVRVSGPRPGLRGPELLLDGPGRRVRLTHTLMGFLVVEQESGGQCLGAELLSVERQGGEYRPLRKTLGIPACCPEGTTAKTPFCFTSVPDLAREYVRLARE